MIKQLCDVRNVITRLRVQLRFGRLSRAPLRLLRLEWRGDHVECDWIARSLDEWDKALRPLSDGNASLQALEDAIIVRDLLFYALHDISSATFRVYRQVAESGPPDLIITGTVNKPEPVRWNVRSLAMQAKLCGFQFCLDNGKLLALQVEEQ